MNLQTTNSLTADIIAFPRSNSARPRFTFRDREILLNLDSKVLDCLGVVLCLQVEDDLGEFATFTVVGECCSSWAVAKQGELLLLWNTKSGADLGTFSTMIDVIYHIEALTFPMSALHGQLSELSEINLASNVVFLTAQQFGRAHPVTSTPRIVAFPL